MVMLDALGIPLDRSPARMGETLTDLLDEGRRQLKRNVYVSVEEMAQRLIQVNGKLDPARAHYLGASNAQALEGGGLGWPSDPHFNRSWPTLHSVEEWGEVGAGSPRRCYGSSPQTRSPIRLPAIP